MFLDYKIIEIIKKLESNGYETYVVGGAPRDSYLERPNHDIDIVTTASLKEIKEVFPLEHFISYQKGITLGLVHNKTVIDISSTNELTIEEDILRRDFTINTLLYHPIRGWKDYLNAKHDIDKKILKSVGNPINMIKNDPLRILRAIRFEAILKYKIDNKLLEAMFENKHLLKNIASERINDELTKILLVDTPSIYIRKYIDIFDIVIPGLIKLKGFNQHNKYHVYDVLEHTLKVLDTTTAILELRLAALFHDFEKPSCFTIDDNNVGHFYGHDEKSSITADLILKQLHYPYKLIDKVVKLIYYHDYKLVNDEKKLLKFISKFGIEDIDLLMGLKRADVLGQNLEFIDRIYELDEIEKKIYYLIDSKKFITKELLNIKGSDLIEIGYPQNKTISTVLNLLLEKVRNNELENDKEILLDYASKLIIR